MRPKGDRSRFRHAIDPPTQAARSATAALRAAVLSPRTSCGATAGTEGKHFRWTEIEDEITDSTDTGQITTETIR